MTNANPLLTENQATNWEPNSVCDEPNDQKDVRDQNEFTAPIDARHQIAQNLALQRLAQRGISWDKLAEI